MLHPVRFRLLLESILKLLLELPVDGAVLQRYRKVVVGVVVGVLGYGCWSCAKLGFDRAAVAVDEQARRQGQ